MTPEKIRIFAFVFLGGLVLSGCGQTVKFYSGPALPEDQIATLFVPDNRTELIVDGKFVEWNRYSPPQDEKGFGEDDVHVKLLPGLYRIEWSLNRPEYSWTYDGSGTLNARPGGVYEIHFDCLLVPGSKELVARRRRWGPDYNVYRFEVKDYATWITDKKSGDIVVGKEPPW